MSGTSGEGGRTALDVIEGVDLSGRVAIVTGASGGIGVETARALAAAGAHVTLAVRNEQKGDEVAKSIRDSTGRNDVAVGVLELAEPASVRAFARRFLDAHPQLHILVNNAGIMACPLERTAEGWELQFATNHLGHFLLTGLLLPALRAGAPARIVNLSSSGHRFSPVDFEDIHFERRPYDKWLAYGQAKTANILFTVELERRLGRHGIHAYAVHPGAILTELGRHLKPEDVQALTEEIARQGGIEWKRPEQGAATSVWAATAPALADVGGVYLEECAIGEPMRTDGPSAGYAPYAMDAEAAMRLWEESERMLGERFAI